MDFFNPHCIQICSKVEQQPCLEKHLHVCTLTGSFTVFRIFLPHGVDQTLFTEIQAQNDALLLAQSLDSMIAVSEYGFPSVKISVLSTSLSRRIQANIYFFCVIYSVFDAVQRKDFFEKPVSRSGRSSTIFLLVTCDLFSHVCTRKQLSTHF